MAIATVIDRLKRDPDRAVFICDFSPPRGGSADLLESAAHLDVDFVSVAYNPGKSARVNSVAAAHWIKANIGRDVVFTLATRDMNKVAVQSTLLGAQLLGLENVIVVKGDEFTDKELSLVSDVNDYRPTDLLRSINELNRGVDYKGLKLRSPTEFCVGASIDLARGIESESRLTHRKVAAGAHFFVSQPTFHPSEPKRFVEAYAERYGEDLTAPIFHGVQLMAQDSIIFGSIPQWVTDDLAKGRSGEDIALEVLQDFTDAGIRSIYLVPPILRGGRRDYEVAQAVLEAFRG